jgi:hypothetical protein
MRHPSCRKTDRSNLQNQRFTLEMVAREPSLTVEVFGSYSPPSGSGGDANIESVPAMLRGRGRGEFFGGVARICRTGLERDNDRAASKQMPG